MPEKQIEIVHKSDLPRKSETEQSAFFDEVLQRSLIAEARAGVVDHFFDVAETVVRIVFAGDNLARLLVPALSHLEIAPSPSPDVTFHVWDSRSTGVAMAGPPCALAALTDRGEIWGMDSARIRSAFHWFEYSVNLMNTGTNTGIYWVRMQTRCLTGRRRRRSGLCFTGGWNAIAASCSTPPGSAMTAAAS